jgi:predicted transcriptional regulator
LTTNFVSIKPQSQLTEMVGHIVDNRVDELIVLDEFDRPAGIVSATEIVIAVENRIRELAKAGEGPTTARKSK